MARRFTAVSGKLLFVTGEWNAGFDLWTSDGTTSGTNPLVHFAAVGDWQPLGDILLFAGQDAAAGSELWRSDGTVPGTMRVMDINPGVMSSSPRVLGVAGGALIFAADAGDGHGVRLWRSDGTSSGTVVISDVHPFDIPAADLNGAVLFSAFPSDDSLGPELWKTDGTVAGTMRVMQIAPSQLMSVGGTAFFAADDGSVGQELWSSDGTPAGTVLVKDLVPGPSGSHFGDFTAAGGRLLFRLLNGASGVELWISDGTADGTLRLLSGLGWEDYLDSSTATVGTSVLFRLSGYQLWRTDGTAVGTARVGWTSFASSGASPFATLDGEVLFGADDGQTGTELWKSDGTPEGTVQIANLAPETRTNTHGSYPLSLTAQNDTLLFVADDGIHGAELWRSDGTDGGTVIVRDINPGPPSAFGASVWSSDRSLVRSNGTLFFVADDGSSGIELWKSDGSEGGTLRVTNLNLDTTGSALYGLTDVHGLLFFIADDGMSRPQLWRTDGTEQGTVRLIDIDLARWAYPQHQVTVANGMAYFVSGTTLWRSDGGAPGTVPVRDLDVGADGWIGLSAVNGTLFILAASSPSHQLNIWMGDGSLSGTALVATIAGVFAADQLTPVNNTLFFATYDDGSANLNELWRTDGTPSGTIPLSPIIIEPDLTELRSFDGAVYFTADTDVPIGLFRTDGTAAGTGIFKRLVARSALTDVGGHFLFFACAPIFEDCAIWESDGTAARTRRFASVGMDAGGTVAPLVVAGSAAFFASTGFGDVELWAVPLDTVGRCGDGQLDPGEVCDDGGESARCGVDCTVPVCGDATVNTSAGEDCDDAGIGGCCDWSCHATPAGSPCDARDACRDAGTCDDAGICQPGAPLECDDRDPNTIDSCNQDQGCVHGWIPLCRGDCNGDDYVTIDELTTMVNIALGQDQMAACLAGDADRDGHATVNELITATRSALWGCPLLDDLG